MLRKLIISMLVLTTCLMANSLSLNDNGDVGYESSDAIGGFQFIIDGEI